MTPEQREEKHLKHLTKELNLDANQQKQVGAIIKEKRANAEKMKAEKANLANMTKEQKMQLFFCCEFSRVDFSFALNLKVKSTQIRSSLLTLSHFV